MERKPLTLDWSTIALVMAKETCTTCRGYGTRKRIGPCHCVLRAIFRACYERYRQSQCKRQHVATIDLTLVASKHGSRKSWSFGRKNEEYCADFELVSRRALNEAEFKIFSLHYIEGAEWMVCCRRLGIDRGNFFHSVYRIQQKLGQVFRELKPYALFPLDEYFSGGGETGPREPKLEPEAPIDREPYENSRLKRLKPALKAA